MEPTKKPKKYLKEHGLHGFKERMGIKNTWGDSVADFMTESFGTVWFLFFHVVFFTAWILINLGVFPLIPAFDPFPFGLLTMVVSLEAIFLSIIVLMSQNRASRVADFREEIDFEINIRAEEEITRVLNMLDEIHDHMGLNPEDDEELTEMKKKTDIEKLGAEIQNKKKR